MRAFSSMAVRAAISAARMGFPTLYGRFPTTSARPPGGRALVVGNLPYSVGKPILAALIAARTAIDEKALMRQREVGERVGGPPGSKTEGSLSGLTPPYFAGRV